jgi:hypothetical protein
MRDTTHLIPIAMYGLVVLLREIVVLIRRLLSGARVVVMVVIPLYSVGRLEQLIESGRGPRHGLTRVPHTTVVAIISTGIVLSHRRYTVRDAVVGAIRWALLLLLLWHRGPHTRGLMVALLYVSVKHTEGISGGGGCCL